MRLVKKIVFKQNYTYLIEYLHVSVCALDCLNRPIVHVIHYFLRKLLLV